MTLTHTHMLFVAAPVMLLRVGDSGRASHTLPVESAGVQLSSFLGLLVRRRKELSRNFSHNTFDKFIH